MRRHRISGATLGGVGVLAALLAVCGCGAPTQLASYPTREIDRPYTLPVWLDTTTMGASAQLTPRAESRFLVVPVLLWATAMGSPKWTLDVPSGVRYQPLRNESQTLGMRAGLNAIGYSSTLGFLLRGGGSVSYWHRIANSMSWRSTVAWSYFLRTTAKDLWSTQATSGPMLQVTDRVFARPWVGVFYGDASDETPYQGATVGAPVGVELGWNVNLSWSVRGNYELDYVGYREPSHIGQLLVVHYW